MTTHEREDLEQRLDRVESELLDFLEESLAGTGRPVWNAYVAFQGERYQVLEGAGDAVQAIVKTKHLARRGKLWVRGRRVPERAKVYAVRECDCLASGSDDSDGSYPACSACCGRRCGPVTAG